jgi:hypothetical protein
VCGALSGGRGPYPHLTTRGVAGPSLLRGAFCGPGGGWRPQLLFWVQSTVQRVQPFSGLRHFFRGAVRSPIALPMPATLLRSCCQQLAA